MKKTILFVDDEPNILSSLKRTFRSLRQDKELYFVESGQAALDFLADHTVDIIVSDMRMPGMDGATLLTTIQQRYPHVIRIMLTGQADEHSILRTVGVVHQFIAKPADPESMKQILERACALQDLMQNEQLQRLAASIGTLPSLPSLYMKLLKKLKDPECTLTDIGEIISQDLAMTAKILQLVNSSFFGFFKKIETPARAVNLLGVDTVKALVLSVGVFTELHLTSSETAQVEKLWRHSQTVAAFAKCVAAAETEDKDTIEEAFIAGFMHDIGKLLLLSTTTSLYLETLTLAATEQITDYEAEDRIFNATHGDIGGYLLGLWGLTGPTVETAAFHHHLDHYPAPAFCVPLIVHVADCFYYQLHPDPNVPSPQLNLTYLEQIGKADRIAEWLTLCQQLDAIDLP